MAKTIKDLKFDDKNFNRHNKDGMALLEKSLQKFGAGRSILLDKDDNIIAGNGIVEAAGQIGLEKVKVVEATGDEIIAVKRTDVALDSEQGREMALADNATASANLEWDEDILSEQAEKWGFDTDEWGVSLGIDPLELDEKYSQLEGKIIAEKPEKAPKPSECFSKDEDYFDKLEKIQEIPDSDLRELLMTRLSYFVDIDYGMVAGLWYHADEKTKKLVENLGMVILDKNGLIENGFADIVGFTGGGQL